MAKLQNIQKLFETEIKKSVGNVLKQLQQIRH